MLGFAEMVLHKLPPKDPKSGVDGNMGSRWGEGAFLGFHRQSRTYIVATPDGIAKARSICTRPGPDRFAIEDLKAWASQTLSALPAKTWIFSVAVVPALAGCSGGQIGSD